eukprot:SAG11_NODE_6692_length_1265_cov_3.394511_1_plen_143_part_00
MSTTGSTTRSKAKTQKSGTAVSTPKGSRTGTDGSSVQIPIWASTAKIDQLEDLSIDSADDENDGQVDEKMVDPNKMADTSTPGIVQNRCHRWQMHMRGLNDAIHLASVHTNSPTWILDFAILVGLLGTDRILKIETSSKNKT